ncbi:uncharacterized protein LOC143287378 [Babylonia areolata]|uniref:uncharacterized protein LOC143287378 n=1 Tax=Babylonia areolata TaxID=304850 RepID=UPI003FD568E9
MNRLFITVLVLVAMGVNDVMSQTSPPCDVNNMPTVDHLRHRYVQGKWYLKLMTPILPIFQNVTSHKTTVRVDHDEGQTFLDMWKRDTISGSENCIEYTRRCHLLGSTCVRVDTSLNFTIIDIDYDSVLVLWFDVTIGNQTLSSIGIFVRDPYVTPDLSDISTPLTQFCGVNATNPSSGFYDLQLTYDNLPGCFY